MEKMVVNRGDFLSALESVRPGISGSEYLDQASSFVFQHGKVQTFNEEMACQCRSGLPKTFAAAIPAKPLVAVLSKMTEDQIQLSATEAELTVVGKRRKVDLCTKPIAEEMETVDVPTAGWAELHADFTASIEQVQGCCGKDAEKFVLTCIHVAPRYVEAFDNMQICRYKIRTGFKESTLFRKEALRHVSAMGMVDFVEDDNFVHFRNPTGLTISCRKYSEPYTDLNHFIEMDGGTEATLSQGLSEAAKLAEIFSSENMDDNFVTIEMADGQVKVTGKGNSGRFAEVKRAAYDGPPLKFSIPPKMLVNTLERGTTVEIDENKMKLTGSRWIYVVSLGQVK